VSALAEAAPIAQPCPHCNELALFDKKAVADRAKRSIRQVEMDMKREDCPLRLWHPRTGTKRKITDAPTLAAYLGWLAKGR
jgi:hypothetical protein